MQAAGLPREWSQQEPGGAPELRQVNLGVMMQYGMPPPGGYQYSEEYFRHLANNGVGQSEYLSGALPGTDRLSGDAANAAIVYSHAQLDQASASKNVQSERALALPKHGGDAETQSKESSVAAAHRELLAGTTTAPPAFPPAQAAQPVYFGSLPGGIQPQLSSGAMLGWPAGTNSQQPGLHTATPSMQLLQQPSKLVSHGTDNHSPQVIVRPKLQN